MPSVKRFKVKKNFISECIRTTKAEGKKKDQQLAQCLSQWRDSHRGKDAVTDYSKYINSTPKDGGEYYDLMIPKNIIPPEIGDTLNINGIEVIAYSKSTPEDIYRGKGAPVARSMEANGIGWSVNCLPPGHEYLNEERFFKYALIHSTNTYGKMALNLLKEVEKANDLDKPSVFLGGSCEDNKWREEIKKEFKDKLSFIDPYDPDWKAEDNIYEELAAIVNADYTIFYKGGEGSEKEKDFMDHVDRDYEEFDTLDDLKKYLNRVAEPVAKKSCISKYLKKMANSLMTAKENHKYGMIAVEIPSNIASKIKAWGKANVPDNEIYEPEGRETDSHITVLYGLTFEDANLIENVTKFRRPFKITLNKTSTFTDNPKYDVLKVGVNSPDLQKLHRDLNELLKPKQTFPGFFPHITIAYLKKGNIGRYLDQDFSEYSFDVNSLIYNSPKDKKTNIKLTDK